MDWFDSLREQGGPQKTATEEEMNRVQKTAMWSAISMPPAKP